MFCVLCCSRLKFYFTTTYVILVITAICCWDLLLGDLHNKHVSNNIYTKLERNENNATNVKGRI
jgi:hypothetical protein